MSNTKMFGLIALAGSLAQATPVARASGFSSVCSDISLDSHFWLHATCPDDSGASVDSTVYLPFWIENDQGKLVVRFPQFFRQVITTANKDDHNSGKTSILAHYSHENERQQINTIS